MITYAYWFLVIIVGIALLVLFGTRNKWKLAIISCGLVFIAGMLAYYFHFEQVFVKRYGGVMSVSVPKGHRHITATWKDEHLWIENYDPESNTCYFNEYSKGNLLQGKVVIKNCSPVSLSSPSGGRAAAP
ncbi:hypothetical protein G8770_19110 [Aestuariicella hydrocarbonica]|uniref:Uncharacterized protein n=1 Tax=Pseudomaricurvus hydrocarbonicus TaxID=1470433 RepID=A0A9E5MNQ8_9GAMM|nr:hypothetical protein [Aestuariicella hydrocarbonica]NHO67661.1 hypothetical protein [Aestuariicella hydrocarbonica]